MDSSNSGFYNLTNFFNFKITTIKSNLPTKNTRYLQDSENDENVMHKKVKNDVDENSITSSQLLENETMPGVEKDLTHTDTEGEETEEIDVVSLDSSQFLLDPSCFLKLPSPPKFTESPYLIHSPTASTQNLMPMRFDEQKSNVLLDIPKKICLNNFPSAKRTSEETIIKANPIIACITGNNSSTRMNSKQYNIETDIFNTFFEDLEIVDPDILYNVKLLKHLSNMKPIVQKISKMPFDQSLLKDCMLLSPMPEKKQLPQTLTQQKIENFTKDISEYKCDIGSDDWNKTMVKRAAIFTTHAELMTASEEHLYILVDAAIDFIKNVTLIMKQKFDIEKNNSCPDSTDPVNKGLEQIGVKGSLLKLVKRNDNYVIDRRDTLLGKCQNLQSIINNYTDQHLAAQNNRNRSYINDYFVQENPVSETFMVNEEITLDENESDEESIQVSTSPESVENELIIEFPF